MFLFGISEIKLYELKQLKRGKYLFLENLFFSILSVSYTHLDVYKRQLRVKCSVLSSCSIQDLESLIIFFKSWALFVCWHSKILLHLSFHIHQIAHLKITFASCVRGPFLEKHCIRSPSSWCKFGCNSLLSSNRLRISFHIHFV